MAENTNKPKVYVELFDLAITPKQDDRFGHVLSGGSASVDDLVEDARVDGSEIDPVMLKAGYNVLKSYAMKRAMRGQRVEFGLGIFYLEPTGIFIGDAAKWDSSKNRLIVKALPSVEIREGVKSITVEVLGMAQVVNIISSVTDVFTGQQNVCLTRGGMAHINGSKIKVAGTNPDVGLKLVQKTDGTVWIIPETSIGINDPSRISFVIPADLPIDEYTLTIVTQYSGGGKELKNPRTLTLDYGLTVE